ncbi:MAG: hypothetical protein CM15mP15_2860 [Prochlorococcus sp.]|nr:MAG: hypothetical protein CM15mP15_2860 [Prochlorococcus sp.]
MGPRNFRCWYFYVRNLGKGLRKDGTKYLMQYKMALYIQRRLRVLFDFGPSPMPKLPKNTTDYRTLLYSETKDHE